MKTLKLLALCVCSVFFMFSCSDDDDGASVSECDFNSIVDGSLFEVPSPNAYVISNAEINEDCIEITIQSGGCSGDSWEVDLISNYPISNGFTNNAVLSLKLVDLELCEAYISKTYSFDLSEIHDESMNTIFSVEGWDETFQITN